ncbi:MAG: MFS transporter [Chloroflexota bacterium]|jgi:DHA3 family macrolide efflux protein-like MFS transporter
MSNQDNSREDQFAGWKKKITLFLASQTLSLFGSSLVQYAIIWYITLTTQSGIMMTISTICGFLPQIAISLFAGVWADRYSRKLLIIAGDVLIAFFTLILIITFLLGYRELWLLFAISAIRSIGAGIQTPAVSAFIPQIVPPDRLMRVSGLNGSIQAIMMIVAPAASGALLVLWTLEVVFFVDLATAAAAVLIMSTIDAPPHPKESLQAGYLSNLFDGLQYVQQTSWVRSLLIYYALFMFLITPAAFLTPLLIARSFGGEVWRLTANEMLFGGGAVLGGMIIAAWGGFRNRMHTLVLADIMFGLLTAALGLAGVFWVYLAIIFATGIFMPFFNSPSTVLLQEKVPPEIQGRVFSLVGIVVSASMPVGMMVFGPISDVIRVELLLIVTGALITVMALFMLGDKQLIQAGKPTVPNP